MHFCRSFLILISTLFLVLLLPIVVPAQFKGLDSATSNIVRGLGSGDPQALVSGIANGDQVELHFPGLMQSSGFYGRDQAAYQLDALFNKVKPSAFDVLKARKVAAEGQYLITGKWTIQVNGKPQARTLRITLRQKNTGWSLVSIHTTGTSRVGT